MENLNKENYVYVIMDTLNPGNYRFGEYEFEYQPFYIGVSSINTIYNREERHIHYAKNGNDITNNKYKMNIINRMLLNDKEPKYIKLCENMTRDDAFSLEKELISLFGVRYDGSGPLVNISAGGDGGDTFTNNPRKEEIREKHRQNALGSNNNMYGRPLEKNPSHLSKLSGEHWNKGRKADDELRKKFSEQRKGHKNKTSKVTLLFDINFNLVGEFQCGLYASEYLGVSGKVICRNARLNGSKEIPYHLTKGHILIYKEDWENKFKQKQDEIIEFLKNYNFVKNQYTK